jgi:hypothetical protein
MHALRIKKYKLLGKSRKKWKKTLNH